MFYIIYIIGHTISQKKQNSKHQFNLLPRNKNSIVYAPTYDNSVFFIFELYYP